MEIKKLTPEEIEKEKQMEKIKKAIWIYNKLIETYPPIFIENLLNEYKENK
jgi:DNA-binding XRE family transcriptional regulator